MAESSDNRRRVSARVARAADRIGDLPDDVLRRVVSQLRSREAVHTSLLAQRWRQLWRSVPVIDVSFQEFDDSTSEDDFQPGERFNRTIEREVVFKEFVNSLLMHRDPVGLDEFRLLYSSSTGDSSDDANQWISHAIQRDARAIKVVDWCEPIVLVPRYCAIQFKILEKASYFLCYNGPRFLQSATNELPSIGISVPM